LPEETLAREPAVTGVIARTLWALQIVMRILAKRLLVCGGGTRTRTPAPLTGRQYEDKRKDGFPVHTVVLARPPGGRVTVVGDRVAAWTEAGPT
jgi:hypothetical protein